MKKTSIELNAILNGIKQCIGILFPLVTFPYVSRMLGEEGFGKYSFSWSIVSYFVLLAGLGINTYAVREGARVRDDKNKISQFCSEAFTINFITTTFSLCILLIVVIFNEKIRGYYSIIAIQSIALILNFIGRDWINGIFEDYLYITVRYLIIQVISLILMFSLIKNSGDVWKYSLIALFASFGGNIPNILYIRKYTTTKIVKNPRLNIHLKPLLILFVTQIAISIYVNADITMLGFFSDDVTVGIYSLSSKIYNLIKTVVNAMVTVTLPRMTYVLEKNPESYGGALKKICSYLTIVVFPVAVGLFMMSNEVILIAGGRGYQSGNLPLKLLSLAIIPAVYCTYCMNSILIANRKEKDCLRATLLSAFINIILNFIVLPLLGMTGAAITTIIAELVNIILLYLSSRKYIKIQLIDYKNIIQSIISCVFIVLSCYLVRQMNFGIMFTFIVSVVLSILTYFSTLALMKNENVLNIIKIIQSKLFLRGTMK